MIPLHNNTQRQTKLHADIHAGKPEDTINHHDYTYCAHKNTADVTTTITVIASTSEI